MSALSRVGLFLVFLSLIASGAFAQVPSTPTWPVTPTYTGHTQVRLVWNPANGAASYEVYRAATLGGAATLIQSGVTNTTYTDTGLSNGTRYYYKLKAVNTNGSSGFSAEVTGMANVRIDCGNTSTYTDAAGATYAADTGSPGGSIVTTMNPITPPTDATLFQLQRAGTSSFTYTLPTANGFYGITLKFAEIQGGAVGANKFKLVVNGQTLANSLDINSLAGGQNKALTLTFATNVTGGQLTVQLAPITGSAAIAGFYLGPPPAPPAPVSSIAPSWASEQVPSDAGTGADGNGLGPGSSMSVDLTSLAAENTPGADIAAYNPVGPSVAYARMYRSSLVTDTVRKNAPGLSPGWTDNYDIQITSQTPGSWVSLTLRYPDGGTETLPVTTPGGVPTITAPAGSPYLVNGTPTMNPGQWSDITITFKDRSAYRFTPPTGAAPNNPRYLFTRITNLVQRYVAINRDAANGFRVNDITNDAGTMLLKFNYNGSVLQNVQDVSSPNPGERRQVNYFFSGALIRLSRIAPLGGTASDRWNYQYVTIGTNQYLSAAGCPNPASGTGATVNGVYGYDGDGLVRQIRDGKNLFRTYQPDSGTRVVVNAFNSNGTVAETYTQRMAAPLGASGLRVDVGSLDGLGNQSDIFRTDATNRFLPTSVKNRNGKIWDFTYDAIGNPLSAVSPRGVTVTNTYNYGSAYPGGTFTLGQLTGTQATNGGNSLIGTTYTYYSAAPLQGLVQTVTSPKPGTTFPGSTVTTSYTYTPNLGNVATITAPNANGNQIITFNYGASEKLGQPLSVTVSGPDAGGGTSQATTYTYDGRGNVLSVTDASGNTTDYTYNLADQVLTVQQPATNETGTGRVTTTYAYQYPGGSLTSVTLADESGTPVRQVVYTYTAEGEVASVSGSTQPVSYVYDAAGRVTRLTDGRSNNTYYLYNQRGDLLQTQYPGSSGTGTFLSAGTTDTLTNTDFDSNQNVKQSVDGRGITTNYTRSVDPENLVTAVGYMGVPGGMTANPLAFTYDVWGRLASRTDGVTGQSGSAKTYSFDDLGNPLTITTNFVGGPQGQLISYAYNSDGSRLSMGSPVGTYGYQYDGVGRLTAALYPWLSGSASVTHTYLANGWLSQTQSAGSGVNVFQTKYTYNNRGLVKTLINNILVSGTTYLGSQFVGMKYDAAGNRLRMDAFVPTQGPPYNSPNPIPPYAPECSRSVTFGYDEVNFRDILITEASVDNSSDPNYTNAYGQQYTNNFQYDAAYNPTQIRSGAAIPYNANNQRTSAGFGHDGNGNPTAYAGPNFPSGTAFAFDVEDRLTSASVSGYPTRNLTASYGADGLRAMKMAGGVTRWFLYDEAGASQTPLIEESFSGGVTTVTAANGFAANGWRARHYPQRSTLKGWFYTYDPQGNYVQRSTPDMLSIFTPPVQVYATALVDAYGLVKEYQAFNGQSPAAIRDPVGFGGQWGYYTDFETAPGVTTGNPSNAATNGLLCLTNRYYDPATGRFVTRDPIGYDGGINLYSFAGGNPVNETDPDGFGPPKRAPHPLKATAYNPQGSVKSQGSYVSGGMTAQQKAMGFPKGSLDSHTEPQALRNQPLSAGDSMVMEGQYRPCPTCKGVMNRAARATGARIEYQWAENGKTQTWLANAPRGFNKILGVYSIFSVLLQAWEWSQMQKRSQEEMKQYPSGTYFYQFIDGHVEPMNAANRKKYGNPTHLDVFEYLSPDGRLIL